MRDLRARHGARAPHGGVTHAGALACGLEPLRVRLLVHEAEHVDRFQAGVLLAERIAVEQLADARIDAQPEMVAAARADALVLVELLVVEHLLTVRTLRPQVRRVRLAATAEGQLDGHQLRAPTPGDHGRAGDGDARSDRAADQQPPVGQTPGLLCRLPDNRDRHDLSRRLSVIPRVCLSAQLIGQPLLEQERGMESRQPLLEQLDRVTHAGLARKWGLGRWQRNRHTPWPVSRASMYASACDGRVVSVGAASEPRPIWRATACSARWINTRVAPSDRPSTTPISRVLISSTKRRTSACRRSVGSLSMCCHALRQLLAIERLGLDVVR